MADCLTLLQDEKSNPISAHSRILSDLNIFVFALCSMQSHVQEIIKFKF